MNSNSIYNDVLILPRMQEMSSASGWRSMGTGSVPISMQNLYAKFLTCHPTV